MSGPIIQAGLVIAPLLMVLAGIDAYRKMPKDRKTIAILWTAGSAVYLLVSILLSAKGPAVLELSIAPILGSIYPALIATSILAAGYPQYWRYYLGFAALMIILIALGTALDSAALKGAAHGTLHGISGLILVFLPLAYFVKKQVNVGALVVSLGGLVISIGGLTLALAAQGVEWAVKLLGVALYPVLILSPLLLAIGFYLSQGLTARPEAKPEESQ